MGFRVGVEWHNSDVLLAYIDEIGETGAFVSRSDRRFNTSPAFGYAGFVIPAPEARRFGQIFTEEKRKVFASEIAASSRPAQWEKKGSQIFHRTTLDRFPQQIRVFNGLVHRLRALGGSLFYYADEKQRGTPRQTRLDTVDREAKAMRETLNRLARNADDHGGHLLVLMDQINEKQRVARMPAMYAHLFSRSGEYAEMKRIVEPPMHLDSAVSSNIQFADWVAACVSRAVDYQLIEASGFRWIASGKVNAVIGAFTGNSKVHLWQRSVPDLHHSDLFRLQRPLYPDVVGHRIGSEIPDAFLRTLRGVSERERRDE